MTGNCLTKITFAVYSLYTLIHLNYDSAQEKCGGWLAKKANCEIGKLQGKLHEANYGDYKVKPKGELKSELKSELKGEMKDEL